MAIESLPLTPTLVRQLFDLACTPFTLRDFRQRWLAFGWAFNPAHADEFEIRVQVAPDWPLLVGPLGDRVAVAIFPFCYWEAYDLRHHEDPAEFHRQRAAYDAAFEAAVQLTCQHLPPPFLSWQDTDEAAHRAVAWEGKRGVIVLQQACFDPQVGIEIDFWLCPCTAAEFRPTSPLIDWLNRQALRLHEEDGFPPLRW